MFCEPVCISDFEQHAKLFLPKISLDYYLSGANEELTLNETKNAFKRLKLRPRVLRDVSSIDTSTSILGNKVNFPICIAPTAMQKMAHPDGEVATAKAASEAGTCMTLSSWSTSSIEDVARNSSGLKWFQLYVYKDKDVTKNLILRAEREGYKALVVTADTPYLGRRYADSRNKFSLPPHLTLANYENMYAKVKSTGDSGLATLVASLIDPTLTWNTISWLKSVTKLPIVVKGILTKEDAELAVQHGCDGILVSNHGARQLDSVPTTIEALPEVVKAVGGRCEVYMDGGVRFGTDVFKALTLGAKAVFIGRPVLWGLAYEGKEGVLKIIKILKDEFELTMGLMGCANLQDITSEMVVNESCYSKI